MQQKKRRRVFRPGFSIKDREPIYLGRAIKSRVFHRSFLSLCEQLKRQNHRNGKLQCVRSMHDTALSCHLENNFQLDRRAERKARDTINQAAWILVFSEDVLQQVRSSIRDFRLIANISRSGDGDPSRMIRVTLSSDPKCSRATARALSAARYAALRPVSTSSSAPTRPTNFADAAFRGKHPGQKKQIAGLHRFHISPEWFRRCR